MAKTDIKIYATEAASGKKTTTSITYVNPDADSQTLKTFAQKLNAFTTNNYVETDRIHTLNVDTEETPKQTGSIEWTNKTWNVTNTDYVETNLANFTINGTTHNQIAETGLIFGTATLVDSSTIYRYPITIVDRTTYDSLKIEAPENIRAGKTMTLDIAVSAKDAYTAATTRTTYTFD